MLSSYVLITRDMALRTVIVGDFNAHSTDFPPRIRNLPGSYMEEFMRNNLFRCRDPPFKPTYFTSRTRRNDTKIDYFWVSANLLNVVSDFYINETIGPDHYPGMLKMRIDLTGDGYLAEEKFNFKCLKSNNMKELF